MPAREDAWLHTAGADQSGIAFLIHDTDFSLSGQSQILSGTVHNHGEPLPVSTVPEHQKAGILGKEMLTVRAVGVRQIGY